MDRKLSADKLGYILARTRTKTGKSQKYMAQMLGKSVGTIMNWEAGVGAPNVIDFLNWFDIIGINPLKYFLEFMYPRKTLIRKTFSYKEALVDYIINVAPDSEIEKLAYCIFENEVSSWHAQLDMITAHNHTTLMSRINIAQMVLNNYEMEYERDELLKPDDAIPDIENLKTAIERGKRAVFKKKIGYDNV